MNQFITFDRVAIIEKIAGDIGCFRILTEQHGVSKERALAMLAQIRNNKK